jgi:hypothetical protein
MNSIVIMYFIVFVIIADIPRVIENVFTQGEKADQNRTNYYIHHQHLMRIITMT